MPRNGKIASTLSASCWKQAGTVTVTFRQCSTDCCIPIDCFLSLPALAFPHSLDGAAFAEVVFALGHHRLTLALSPHVPAQATAHQTALVRLHAVTM